MAQHKSSGLGLGLPCARDGSSRNSHGRSSSSHVPAPSHPTNGYHSAGRGSLIRPNHSANPIYFTAESIRATAELNAVATAIVGTVSEHNQTRSCSNSTNTDTGTGSALISQSGFARARARSAPATAIPEDLANFHGSSRFPRADSLLRLDSKTASKDLKNLLTSRVRHAPINIDVSKANRGESSSSSSSPIKNELRLSQFEPEKSRPRIEVSLVLNNHVAVQGGCFTGTLVVRTRKPRRGEPRYIRIDGGKARVIGFEGVSETEKHAFYQSSTPLSQASQDCEKLYDSDSDSDGFRIAQEGTFSLPFKIDIPHSDPSRPRDNIPKGVIRDDNVSAMIKYILLVSFKVRDDPDNSYGIDQHANLTNISISHFYRNVELWPTYGPMALYDVEMHPMLGETGTVSARTAQGIFLGGSGMLHLAAVLHRKVWIAGQRCTVYIGAWNETKKFIKTMTLSLIRKTTVTRPNHNISSSSKQIAETTLEAVRGTSFGPVTSKGWWGGIEPGEACEFSHSIEIPADTLTIRWTHIIDISYILRVTLVTGSLSSNVSVDLPVRIINAISTDGLPIPPPAGLLIGGLKLPKDVPVSFAFETSPRRVPAGLDLRNRILSSDRTSAVDLLRRQDVEWTLNYRVLGDQSYDENSCRSSSNEDTEEALSRPLASQHASTSHQLYDDLTSGDCMSRLMSELESDLNLKERPTSLYSSQRSSVAGSSILKSQPPTKPRVTFLTPKVTYVLSTEERDTTDEEITDHSCPETSAFSEHSKEPLSRRFSMEAIGSARRHLRQRTNTWIDDADEVLRSIRMDEEDFDSSQGQELALSGRVSGPVTGSSMSSDPWSASGSSYSQPSATYHSSGYETSPEQYGSFAHGRSPSMKLAKKHEMDSMSKDDTPRAGSIARFLPEVMTGIARSSSSRATIVPTLSSPMLAKSQSAHVVGSPVNQYHRFSPQPITTPQLDGYSKAGGADAKKTYASDGQAAVRLAPEPPSGMSFSDSMRYALLRPSSSTSNVEQNVKAHLRSRSGPDPATTAKNNVRSRIAALEERSRSRPASQYSNVPSSISILE